MQEMIQQQRGRKAGAFWAGLLICGSVMAATEPGYPPEAPGYSSRLTLGAAFSLKQIKLITQPTNLPPGVVEEKNLEYGNTGGHSLRLDLFHPEKTAAAVPAIIFIHGGAWSGGNRDMLRIYAISYAQRGYVTAAITYRLSGVAPFPAAVEDCKCAVRWLRANAEKFRVDPALIGVAGGSAGGHLAMMLGYAADQPELEGQGGHAGISSRVQAVVNFYGVYDLTTPFAQKAGPVKKFLGGKTYDEASDAYEKASPRHYLQRGAPPTLVIHGTLDDVVPIEQSDDLVKKLEELQVPHVYDRLPGWPHAMDAAEIVNRRCQYFMNQFFARHLPLPPAK
jgi:acetyl esterase/lipase